MNKCLECNIEISKTNKFCSQSHAATYNNKKRKTNKCLYCDKFIQKGRKFCNHEHQHKYQYISDIKPRIEQGLIDNRRILKKYLKRVRGDCCSECGIDEWKNHVLSTELDHIDGDASNNFPINLRLLCPNCHSITPSWKGRNRGNGRKSRGLSLN